MSDTIICNMCRKPINDPVQAKKKRVYVVLATGHPLPPQRKHDACDAAYAKKKTGLRKSS